MPTFISWSSIELLHNVVRTLAILKENTGAEPPAVTYRGKVKLHGSNCAVQVTPEGVFTQSRSGMITPEDDYKGFAKWAKTVTRFDALPMGVTVFGEWCGPGVERGMAISAVTRKVFAVFAVQVGCGESARVVFDPAEVSAFLAPVLPHPDIHVLPWYGEEFTVDFADRASLDATAIEINRRVVEVEREDPWVKATFGVSGLGEGLVLYPVGVGGDPMAVPREPGALAYLMWKAKGEKHRTAGTKEAVQVDASVVASATDFVDLMVTAARLEQGVSTVGGREPKLTGKFLAWVLADVKKESVAELEASGLEWGQVEKAVQARAREWFLVR